jgi:hypothetical protein
MLIDEIAARVRKVWILCKVFGEPPSMAKEMDDWVVVEEAAGGDDFTLSDTF